MDTSSVSYVLLQQKLEDAFSLDELKQLCFVLEVNFDNLEGNTLTAKSRELVMYCYRYGRTADLLRVCKERKARVDWDGVYKTVYRQSDLPEEWAEPLQQYYGMVKEFNRNRATPFNDARTRAGDMIAFRMRAIAPFLFGQFDVNSWLSSSSIGKRLGAVKYLDWAQDVEFFSSLLARLAMEKPFMQLQILLALDGMLDQLKWQDRALLKTALTALRAATRDADIEYWIGKVMSAMNER